MTLPEIGSEITIRKLDGAGQELWSYRGTILEHLPAGVVVEAVFQRVLVSVEALHFERGDRMVETFYGDRWFNIFEVFAGRSEKRKGWYCNIARPAQFSNSEIRQEDLAIDLVVYPDFRTTVLDMDEFEALGLDPGDRKAALDALAILKANVQLRLPPFNP